MLIRIIHSKQHGWSNGGEQADKIALISEYKFLIAFENSDVVEDYVTGAHEQKKETHQESQESLTDRAEKMINALQAGTVPVYRGSPTSTYILSDTGLQFRQTQI